MSAPEHTDLSVCVDCLMMMANGELGQGDETADREHAETMAREWPGFDLVMACEDECEGHFSWSPCQGCGSTLGGDRHPAAAFKRESAS